MARTSRTGVPANNVAALDNLDLDDMFNDGGDALFDGLDLDMGNMEEITTGDNNKTTGTAPKASTPASTEADDGIPKRRKTKRKTTAPTFFDDLDDDYADNEPAKKKKRTSKGGSPKRGRGSKGGKKGAETTATTTTKKSKASKAAAPAPTTRTASGAVSTPPMGGASAVGQFGTRQKKVVGSKASSTKSKSSKQRLDPKGRQALPTSANRAAAAATGPAPAPPPPAVPVAPPPPPPAPKPAISHSLYCGLSPSNSLFYPFMPALPTEVALKNRKVYTLLDRVHTSFMGYFGHGSASSGTPPALPQGIDPVKENEAIFKLTQEAFKEEKNATSHVTAADRSNAIGVAIGAIRKTISLFDKGKLAQDLLSVCALLRRQHDFTKQNNANMERWCREHFNDEDFAAVYEAGKKKRKFSSGAAAPGSSGLAVPILSTFKVPQVKVKIICTGFKEPKTALIAALPLDPKLATRSGKKKAGVDAPVVAMPSVSSAATAAAAAASAADLTYAGQPPQKRRKAVGGLISRVAQTLESRQNQKVEKRRQSTVIQEKRRRDAAEDTNVSMLHTAGMWKYIQETGYFEDTITDSDLHERFDSIQPMKFESVECDIVSSSFGVASAAESVERNDKVSLTERLMGLLVEERQSSESESNGADDGLSVDCESSINDAGDFVDFTELTEDERAVIQIRMMGLARSDCGLVDVAKLVATDVHPEIDRPSEASMQPSAKRPEEESQNPSVVLSGPQQEKDEIDDIVAGMIEDLKSTSLLISARNTFAQKMARDQLETPEGAARRRQREASILVRGATLLKRNKETKAKAVKSKSKQDDDLGLPW